jgi:hypothetical protein
MDSGGNKKQTITDFLGRFGFFVKPDNYHIIVEKTNYIFPSRVITTETQETLDSNVYFGQNFTVFGGIPVNLNIPIDRISTNKESFERVRNWLIKGRPFLHIFVSMAFLFGFVDSIIAVTYSHDLVNLLVFLGYITLLLTNLYPQFARIKRTKQ